MIAPRLTAAAILAVALGSAGCRPPEPGPATEGSSSSSSSGSSTAHVGTTFTDPDECSSTEECADDLRCVAAYDPGSQPEVGPGVCVPACIEDTDLTQWCFDDAACCGELRCNTVDGFCEPAESSDSDSGSSDSGSSSGSGSDSSSGGDASSGGSSSSSGSSGAG